MSVLALVPARSGSKGIPGKNFRQLGASGESCVSLALKCARDAGCDRVVLTTDRQEAPADADTAKMLHVFPPWWEHLQRPSELASDSASMIAVVQHALQAIPGPPEQIVLLLQPTQPFRIPDHLRQAIALLESSGADSVVSVVPLPLTHSPQVVLDIRVDRLYPWHANHPPDWMDWWLSMPTRRQDTKQAYIRDGTVYAFRRATVDRYGTIYGEDVRPLIIDPADSCELDTEADWADVVRRWEARGHE